MQLVHGNETRSDPFVPTSSKKILLAIESDALDGRLWIGVTYTRGLTIRKHTRALFVGKRNSPSERGLVFCLARYVDRLPLENVVGCHLSKRLFTSATMQRLRNIHVRTNFKQRRHTRKTRWRLLPSTSVAKEHTPGQRNGSNFDTLSGQNT
mmetsp:Transcript_10531/g.64629  ORF Transcript_10531/g.64629 Transcript_10531/m.64629 type:complete len:152 (+) Transcript_10531:269-724(+)